MSNDRRLNVDKDIKEQVKTIVNQNGGTCKKETCSGRIKTCEESNDIILTVDNVLRIN